MEARCRDQDRSSSKSIDLGEDRALLDNDDASVEEGEGQETIDKAGSRLSTSALRRNVALFFVTILLVSLGVISLFRLNQRHHEDTTTQHTSESEYDDQLAIPLHPAQHSTREPATLSFDWNITKGIAAPDGVEKQIYLVNGQFPGPTIEARSGDRIVVHVHNGLHDEGVSLHWHGLQMRGHNSMDGAVGFTQCPISSGYDFVYNFTIGENEHGTFWWHSHAGVQRGDGLYGGFIVHKPSQGMAQDHEEALLLIGDWFHRKQQDVLDWFADTWSLGNEPVPDSLLINGRGRYNCSMAVPARPLNCTNQALGSMVPLFKNRAPKTRLRLVNTGTIAGVTIKIDDATLQAVEVDGGCGIETKPRHSIGILYPGERVDAMLRWKSSDTSSPWVSVYLDDENFGLPNLALNPNHALPALPQTLDDNDRMEAQSIPSGDEHLDLAAVTSSTHMSNFDANEDSETIMLYIKTQKLSHFDNRPMGFINHTSWQPQLPPLLSLNRSSWDKNQRISFIGMESPKPKRVTIVLNNLDDGSHPFHLHGSPFYVLSKYRAKPGEGWGSYNPFDKTDLLPGWTNYETPLRKDTVSVPRRGHVVLTLMADNPGLWLLHCHMLVHMGTGMGTGFHIGDGGDYEHVGGLDPSAAELCNKI